MVMVTTKEQAQMLNIQQGIAFAIASASNLNHRNIVQLDVYKKPTQLTANAAAKCQSITLKHIAGMSLNTIRQPTAGTNQSTTVYLKQNTELEKL
jgi:hypothetical protein